MNKFKKNTLKIINTFLNYYNLIFFFTTSMKSINNLDEVDD